VACAARFQAGRLGLCHAGSLGEFALCEPEFRTTVVDHLAEQERCPRLLIGGVVLFGTGALPARVTCRHSPSAFCCASLPFPLEGLSCRRMLLMTQIACLLSSNSPHNLGALDLAGLAEHGQQHYPSLRREPVADADG
jgi:hypothetical protein